MKHWMSFTLLQQLQARLGMDLPQVDALAAQLRVSTLKPREAAFMQGEACPRLFIVRSGLLKQLYVEPDGSEWIKSFAGPGDLFACLQAIGGQGPTTFASVAIEDSVVEHIDFAAIDALAQSDLSWQKAVRAGFQRLAELKVRRERELLTLTPREHYQRLAQGAPQWIGRIPQKDLAAYLGVTAVGLNRIVRDAGGGAPRRRAAA